MSTINNGGPAFPIPLQKGQSYQGHAPCDGMTLRDYFAGQALMGLIAKGEDELNTDARAVEAYNLADAMLRAREAK